MGRAAPESARRDTAARDARFRALVTGSAVVVLVVALVWFAISVWGSRGSDDRFDIRPLEPSGPAETTLRTLRLAGVEHASVGSANGAAMVRLASPALNTAPDVEIAWQTGLSSLVGPYPEADVYVVQIFDAARPVLEARWDGDDARAAVGGDDARSLRRIARFTFLTPAEEGVRELDPVIAVVAPEDQVRVAARLRDAAPPNAAAMPAAVASIDIEVPGFYLDEKNRVLGLLDETGPLHMGAGALRDAVSAMRTAAPGIPAVPPEVDAGRFWAELAVRTLDEAADARDGVRPIADGVRSGLANTPADLDSTGVAGIRATALAAVAVARVPFGSVLAQTRRMAIDIADSIPVKGTAASVLLETAGVGDERSTIRRVTDFERVAELDLVPAGPMIFDSPVAAAVTAWDGSGVEYSAGGIRRTVAPDSWLAYLRPDGRVYWLAGDGGDIALTDGSLRGWGWTRERVAVVDAARVGRVLAYVGVR